MPLANKPDFRSVRFFKGSIAVSISLLVLVACEDTPLELTNSGEVTEYEVVGDQLLMNGTINSQSLEQFEAIIAQNPQITTIVEQEIDGSIDDEVMIELGYRLRELGLDTHLQAGSEIFSGGVDLFLAGIERTMDRGAVIGVHAWSDDELEATDYPRNSPEHELNRKYVEDMLGADEFYWFTIFAAPFDHIHEMTESEIEQYGLLTQPIR